MRSRNGNCSFLRRYSAIILFSLLIPPYIFGNEYYISYRYVVKNGVLFNQSLLISPAMQKCQGSPYKTIVLESFENKKLQEIINLNNEEFINFISSIGLQIEHTEETHNMQNSSTTVLTLKTQCFKVDFNENFVKISALK